MPLHHHYAVAAEGLLRGGLPIDQVKTMASVLGMTYTQAYRHYRTALRKNPATRAPVLRTRTFAQMHAWKAEMRAFDQARIDLGLATAQEIQRENTAVPHGKRARVVQYA